MHQESGGGWRQRLRRGRAARVSASQSGVSFTPSTSEARVLADFRRRVDVLAASNLSARSDSELLNHLGAVLDAMKRFGPDAAGSVAVAMGLVRLFFNFVKRRLGRRRAAQLPTACWAA